jgi:hypothetical protein
VLCTTWFHVNSGKGSSQNGITPSCSEMFCTYSILHSWGCTSYWVAWVWQSIAFHVFIHTGLVLHKQVCTNYCYTSKENCWIASSFGQLICLCLSVFQQWKFYWYQWCIEWYSGKSSPLASEFEDAHICWYFICLQRVSCYMDFCLWWVTSFIKRGKSLFRESYMNFCE